MNLAKNLRSAHIKIFFACSKPKICARKIAFARSGFARYFCVLENILLELARLDNWIPKILLETRSARKSSCSFCSNSKIFRSVSALHLTISLEHQIGNRHDNDCQHDQTDSNLNRNTSRWIRLWRICCRTHSCWEWAIALKHRTKSENA